MLTLRYGAYSHLPGECAVRINQQVVYDEQTGIPHQLLVSWDVEGRVEADTPAGVAVQVRRLEAAYSRPFLTARLLHADGFVAHELSGAGSLSGVRVVQPPSYPNAQGAEFSTYRNYVLRLECKYPVGDPNTALRSWQETLTFSGGRPARGIITCASGPPVPYISAAYTPYRVTQSGSAVGYLGYPPLSLVVPLFGYDLLEGEGDPITFGSPRSDGRRLVDWPISWTFRFVSAAPLVGRPRTLFTVNGGG